MERHGITLGEIAHGCGQLAVGTAELGNDDLRQFGIGLCDFYRVL